ncbi:hypothetical protein Nos7107_0691 [Nostoc sp. PCC 7107]|nr:hypothetical protein Nos7107_0691 [Nostoc sp. PCC 7107]
MFQPFCSNVEVQRVKVEPLRVKFQPFYSNVEVQRVNVRVLKVKFQAFCSNVEVQRVKVEPLRVKFQPFCLNVEVQRVNVEPLRWKCQEIFCVGCCGMWFCLTQRRKDAKGKRGVFEFFHKCFAESAESGMIYLTVISEQSTVISNIF